MAGSSKRHAEIVISGDASKLETALDKAGKGFGGFGKIAAIGVAAAGAAVGTLAVAAFKMGETFDAAYDTIRVGTGATGDALEGLKDSFKNVVSSVPTDFETASTAIADLNTRLGITGTDLEGLSSQFLELSRITDTDVGSNIETVTRTLGDWGVATEDASGALDMLFRASQATGPSVDRIGQLLTTYGAPLRQFGFGFEESAALLGKFEKEGVNVELVMGSLRQGLGKLAKSGEEPIDAFRRVTEEIAGAGTVSEANAKALELFGARAGPDMAAAIREGRFDIGELFDTISNGTDTIMGAAADTMSFSESWQLLKNKVMVGLEPLVTKVFDGISKAMDKVLPVVDKVMEAFNEDGLSGVFAVLSDEFSKAWPKIKSALGNLMSGLVRWIGQMAPVVASQMVKWGQAFIAWINPLIPPFLQKVGELIGKGLEWLRDTGIPWAVETLGELGQAFIDWVGPLIVPFLEEVGKLIGGALEWLLDEGIPMAVEALLEFGQAFIEWVAPMIPPFLVELGKLLLKLGDWIVTDAAPKLLEKLGEWTASFVTWVTTEAIPKLLEELGKLLVRVGDWLVTEAAPKLLEKLAEWTASFVTWVQDEAIPKLLEKLGDLLEDFGTWIKDTAAPKIIEKLAEWTSAFVDWASEIPQKIFDNLSELGQKIWDAIRDAWDWVKTKVGELNPLSLPGVSIGGVNLDLGSIPGFHAGGTFLPPGGAREGLALLSRGERVTTPNNAAGGGGRAGSGDVVLQLDGITLGRINKQLLVDQFRREGPIPIRVSG